MLIMALIIKLIIMTKPKQDKKSKAKQKTILEPKQASKTKYRFSDRFSLNLCSDAVVTF